MNVIETMFKRCVPPFCHLASATTIGVWIIKLSLQTEAPTDGSNYSSHGYSGCVCERGGGRVDR